MGKTDSEVYEKLVTEKSKVYKTVIIVLAILLFLFIIATVALTVLYCKTGAIGKTTEFDIQTQGGDVQNSNISTNNSTVSGNIQIVDNSPIIIAAIICATAVILVGGLCLLRFLKK